MGRRRPRPHHPAAVSGPALLAGALLLDIQGPSFTADLDALDRDGTYVVYCRTGNRSATAVDRMAALGFAEIYDAGAYDDLAEAGAATC